MLTYTEARVRAEAGAYIRRPYTWPYYAYARRVEGVWFDHFNRPWTPDAAAIAATDYEALDIGPEHAYITDRVQGVINNAVDAISLCCAFTTLGGEREYSCHVRDPDLRERIAEALRQEGLAARVDRDQIVVTCGKS